MPPPCVATWFGSSIVIRIFSTNEQSGFQELIDGLD